MLDLNSVVEMTQGFGYLGVFSLLVICGFGLPLPEDVTLVSGGIIAGLGYANLYGMIATGLAGVIIGDGIVFMGGYLFGARILKIRYVAKIITPERLEKVQEKYAKYGSWLLFFARFMPGLRTPIFLTAGITRQVSYWRFLALDGFAALISVPAWVVLGYYGANNREWLMEWIRRGQSGILILVAATILGVLVLYFVKRSRERRLLRE